MSKQSILKVFTESRSSKASSRAASAIEKSVNMKVQSHLPDAFGGGCLFLLVLHEVILTICFVFPLVKVT